MSKKKENKVKETTVNTESKAPENQVAEEPKEKLGEKVGNFVKENGKKLAIGVGMVAGGILGYALGLKKGKASASDEGEDGVLYFNDYVDDTEEAN